LKPERWGSPLVKRSTRKKRPVTRDDVNNDDDDDDDDDDSLQDNLYIPFKLSVYKVM
jgi:hypothetical protein